MRVLLVVSLLIQMIDAETLYYYKDHKRVMLTPLPYTTKIGGMKRRIEQIRYFKNPHGHTVGVMNEVVVKLNPNTSIEKIQSRYGV